MSSSEETNQGQEQPTQNQFAELIMKIVHGLDPEGTNPKIAEYAANTVEFIMNASNKLNNTSDREATIKEISDDIISKLQDWERSIGEKARAEAANSKEEKE